MFVRFFMCLSYTFCLAVSFNCIRRAVFKPLISPAYIFHVPFLYVLSSCLFVTLFLFWRAFPIRFVSLFVCLFCKWLSYTFCLAVSFNCIRRAVFKALISPAYSTNIVIVVSHKWPPLFSDLGHPFAANGLPLLSFLTCAN